MVKHWQFGIYEKFGKFSSENGEWKNKTRIDSRLEESFIMQFYTHTRENIFMNQNCDLHVTMKTSLTSGSGPPPLFCQQLIVFNNQEEVFWSILTHLEFVIWILLKQG